MRKVLTGVGSGLAAIALFAMPMAFAQTSVGTGPGSGGPAVTLVNPLGTNDFYQVMTRVISFLLVDIAVPLTAIMALVGAFLMITSAGEPEKFSKGRKTLLYAAIGFVIALVANSIVSVIRNILGG